MDIKPQKLIDLALRRGASHAEVYQSKFKSSSVLFETNNLKSLESSDSQGIALRLWKEGAPGLAVAYGEFDSDELADKAIALSALNNTESIELNHSYTNFQPNKEDSISIEQLIESGKNAINQLRDIHGEAVCNGEFIHSDYFTCLVNSLGLHCERNQSLVNYYLELELPTEEDFLSVYDNKLAQGQGKNEIQQTVKTILQRLEWAKKTTLAPKGYIPVLFTPNGSSMLWNTVSEALNSKFALDKTSPWSDKLQKQVMSNSLTLSQNPKYKPYIVPFDDEGTSTQKLSLIKKGNLQQFYNNLANAKMLGMKSTGNGFRPNLKSYPTPTLINLIVEPGEESFSNLIKKLDQCIIIDLALGKKIDISGDFSINIELGYFVQDGLISGRVKNTVVTGNVYKVLENIIGIANDPCWINSIHTPSLLVEGLSIIN